MVLVKSCANEWIPPCTLYRVAFEDGSEISITSSLHGQASLTAWEKNRIYQLTIPGSCVRVVKDMTKSGIEADREVKLAKAISWKLSTRAWPAKVTFDALPFQQLQQKDTTHVFDIVGNVLNEPVLDANGKILKKSVVLENDTLLANFDLIGDHTQLPLKKGDVLAAHGVSLREWQGDRVITTKHLSWILINPSGLEGLTPPPKTVQESPKKRALKMVSTNPIDVSVLQTMAGDMEQDMATHMDSSQKIEARRCAIRVSFGQLDESFFESNFVLQETPTARFLVSTSMSDTTGSMKYVKLWTRAICEILEKNPDEVLQAWQACEDPTQRDRFLADFNNGLQKTWDCIVKVSPWTTTTGVHRADINIDNLDIAVDTSI